MENVSKVLLPVQTAGSRLAFVFDSIMVFFFVFFLRLEEDIDKTSCRTDACLQ